MRAQGLRCLIVLLVALGATADAGKKKEPKKVDLSTWIDGPVRYIARKAEMVGFRRLKTDQERKLYTIRFWARRDPSPETMVNEYRQLFWERVKEANALFLDSSKPGWMTDRGKIHILYGPPTEIQEDIHLRTEGIVGGGYGIIRWIYDRPKERMDMDAIVVVPFVRDGSGEYKVSYDPNLSSVFFDALAIRDAKMDVMSKARAESMGGGRSQLSVMLDLGKMQEVPPQEKVLIEEVETAESYSSDPILLMLNRYLHPSAEGSVLAVTVDLSQASMQAPPALIARFAPLANEDDEDGEPEAKYLGEDSFKHVEFEGTRLAQARIVLDPGQYRVTVLLADPIRVATGLAQTEVVIPAPTDRMRFSDMVLAAELQTVEYRALASHDEPFVVGPFRVTPRIGRLFQPGDTVKLFYEIYDAAAPMQVSYQLEGQEADGKWVSLGQPSVGEQAASSQGWELPTSSRWPAGDYRVRVEVLDAEGRLITTHVPFALGTPDAS